MPQFLPLAAILLAKALEWGALATFLLTTAATLAAGALTKSSLQKDRGIQSLAEGIKVNTRNTNAIIPLIYGQMKVGGNFVFIEPYGTDNNYLYLVQILAEGECHSTPVSIWLNDKQSTDYTSDEYTYWYHSGASDQVVDSNLNSIFSKWVDPLKNTCYIIHRIKYNRDKFQGLPAFTTILKGKALYDFRVDSTAWSDNPVLALYDFMTNSRYGKGYDSSVIDTASWTAAADYCDDKGWKINLGLVNMIGADVVIDTIKSLFRGELIEYDGKFYLTYSDLYYESSVMTITDDMIAQGEDGKDLVSITQPGLFNTPDGLRLRFIDAEKDYNEDSVLVGDSLGVIEEIVVDGCTDRELVSNMGIYKLERSKLDRTIAVVLRDDALKLEPSDIVTFNSTALSISGQLMRVMNTSVSQNGMVSVLLSYEQLQLYNDDYDLVVEDVYTCNLPNPTLAPPSVISVSATEEQYYYRLRNFTKLNVLFDPPSNYPWFNHVEVRISYDNTNWTYLYNVKTDFEILNVKEGQDIWIRLKTVSDYGVKQSDADDYKIQYSILGYATEPDSLSSLDAVVNNNCVNLYADKLNIPDNELYEFRLGSSWAGGMFLAALRAPNLSLYGVKPGDYTFWANTLSNNGSYGSTPRSESVSLAEPPTGWSVVRTETCDYEEIDSDHSNTEMYTYDSENYLKCSHDSAGLVGTFYSPIYDLLSSDTYLIYLLASITVIGGGSTWDDVIPSGNTWEDLDIERSWADIFATSNSSQINISLLYGETSPPTNIVNRLEILSALVTGRYFQVKITITDPTLEINGLIENFSLKFCQ